MKNKILFVALVSAVSLSACNNPSQKNREPNAKKNDGHNHADSSIKKTDSLGMKMDGNELDSKK